MSTVLIIDDEELVRYTLREILNLAGHTVVEAVDGEQGLNAASSQSFDLVISDIVMPNRDGKDAIAQIRARWPDLPIIAMSGSDHVGSWTLLEFAKKAGANVVIAKPFTAGAILTSVKSLLAEMPRFARGAN